MYCHHCGKKLSLIGAKFCAFCGTSLASLSNKPEPPPPEKVVSQASFAPFIAGADEDDYNKYDHVDHLDVASRGWKLEVELVKSVSPVEKLGHLAQMGPESDPIKRNAPYSHVTTEKFLKEFAQEAGAKPLKPE